MNIAVRMIPWVILAVPFIVLAFFYNSIEADFRRRQDWRLSGAKKFLLAILLVAYLALALVPVFIYKTA